MSKYLIAYKVKDKLKGVGFLSKKPMLHTYISILLGYDTSPIILERNSEISDLRVLKNCKNGNQIDITASINKFIGE